MIASVCESAAGKPSSNPRTPNEAIGTTDGFHQMSSKFEPNFRTANHSSTEAEQKDHFRNAMQSFEASTAVQEAEDRLEQLFLEDELSDARLGDTLATGMERSASEGRFDFSGVGDASDDVRTKSTGQARRGSAKVETCPSRVRLEQLSRKGSRAAMTASPVTAGGSEDLRKPMNTTADSGERERLKESLAFAG